MEQQSILRLKKKKSNRSYPSGLDMNQIVERRKNNIGINVWEAAELSWGRGLYNLTWGGRQKEKRKKKEKRPPEHKKKYSY